jgi:hypothetical protein
MGVALIMGETLLHTIGTAARKLGLGEVWLRELCDRGVVECTRDAAGRRLISDQSLREFERNRRKRAHEGNMEG